MILQGAGSNKVKLDTVIHHFTIEGGTFSKTIFKEWTKLETDVKIMETLFKSSFLVEMIKYFGELFFIIINYYYLSRIMSHIIYYTLYDYIFA